MNQIIALAVFVAIAIGGSLLRKHVEKQQREQEAAKRQQRTQTPPDQRRREHGKPPSSPPRTFYGRSGETSPPPALVDRQQSARTPARPQAGRARGERRPGAGQPVTRPMADAAHRSVAHQIRDIEKARSGRPAESPLNARELSGPVADPGPRGVAASRVKRGGPGGYLGNLLQGRNLARAVVLAEILGPPKGLQ